MFVCIQLNAAKKSESPISETVNQFVKTKNFEGNVLVIKNNKTLFKKSYGFANREYKILNSSKSVFRIGSISKSITAAAILKLIEKNTTYNGLPVTVNSPISQFMIVPHDWQDLTIHHLLTHSSGLPEDSPLIKGSKAAAYSTIAELIVATQKQPLTNSFIIGQDFSYSNIAYTVLAHIIELVSKKPYDEFLASTFFKPYGFKSMSVDHQSYIVPNRASGYIELDEISYNECCFDVLNTIGAGSVRANIIDLMKWYKYLLNFNILSKKSVQLMTAPHIAMPSPETFYGYGLFLKKIGSYDAICHNGHINAFTSFAGYWPDLDMYVIILSNKLNKDTNENLPTLLAAKIGNLY